MVAMTMYNDGGDAEDKAKKRAEDEELRKRKQEEEEEAQKQSQRKELNRKIDILKNDRIQVDTKITTLKQVVRRFESTAQKEQFSDEKGVRDLEALKREFVQKKGVLTRLENKISDLENVHGDGHTKADLDNKQDELKKAEDELSDIDHQVMRYENELKNIG